MKKKIVWLVYIVLIIFIIIYFTKISPIGLKEDINKEAPFGLYKDMIEMIRRDNYTFNYKITGTDYIIKYYGKRDKEKIKGIIFYNDEIIENKFLNEYVNEKMLEPNNIFDIIKEREYKLEKKDNARTYSYNIEIANQETEIIINTDLTSITAIIIKFNNITYELNYENIGFTIIN